jgi:hypothetical protein
MAWVGGVFYLLHVPAILTTLVAGSSLRALYGEAGAGQALDVEGSLADPLLGGWSAHNGSPSLGRGLARSSGDGSNRPMLRMSIPGHASPIAGSMG